VPYEGGEVINNRGAIFSTQKAVNYWTDRNETDAEAVEAQLPDLNTGDNSNVMKFSYLNGTNNTAVVLYKINNGGHTAPSIDQQYNSIYLNLVGNQNHDIEMAEEIWAFFEGKTN
jgi:poly(3-hydroxybutyrate) depolymerase